MHTTNQLLDLVAEKFGGVTNYRLHKMLHTSGTATVQSWRDGRSYLNATYAVRVAELLGWEPAYVIACAEHERAARHAAHDPFEQTGEIIATWQKIAEKFRPVLPGVLLALIAAGCYVLTREPQGFAHTHPLFSCFTVLYIMRTWWVLFETENRRRRRKNKPRPQPAPTPPKPPPKGSFWQTIFPAMRSPLDPA